MTKFARQRKEQTAYKSRDHRFHFGSGEGLMICTKRAC
jgi:hypothetical protein